MITEIDFAILNFIQTLRTPFGDFFMTLLQCWETGELCGLQLQLS